MFVFYTLNLILLFILLAVCLLFYFVRARTQYMVMQKNNCSYAWTSWIPCFGEIFFVYSLLGKVAKQQNVKNLNSLFVISLIFMIMSSLFVFFPFMFIFYLAMVVIYTVIVALAHYELFSTYFDTPQAILYTVLYAIMPLSICYTYVKTAHVIENTKVEDNNNENTEENLESENISTEE